MSATGCLQIFITRFRGDEEEIFIVFYFIGSSTIKVVPSARLLSQRMLPRCI